MPVIKSNRRTQHDLLKILFINSVILLAVFYRYPVLYLATFYGISYPQTKLTSFLLNKVTRQRNFEFREKLLLDDNFRFVVENKLSPENKEHIQKQIFNSTCDWNINKHNKQIYTKRLPNIICIGAKKCGTGAFQQFISGHPQVARTISTVDEPHFFDQDESFIKGKDFYKNLFNPSKRSDFVFEKTPKYLGSKNTPKRIKKMLGNIKIVVVVCNPVYRAWSDWSHVIHSNGTGFGEKMKKYKNFEDYVNKVLFELEKNDKGNDDNYIMSIYSSKNSEFSIITNGLYGVQLRYWLRFFKKDNFVFVDGDKLISEPGDEMVRFQRNLGLDVVVGPKDFKWNKEKGFYCFLKGKSKSKCLGKGKGRTRGKDALKMSDYAEAKLDEFYKKFNDVFFKLFKKEYDW